MKRFLLFLSRLLGGMVLLLVILILGVWAFFSAIGTYNRIKFDARVSDNVEISNITYYVSPDGNDSNNGKSPQAAWQTIEKVNQISFKPADQILFEGGKTFSGNLKFDMDDVGASANTIKIGSYGEGRAAIRAGEGTGILIENSMGFEISNLNIVGSGRESNNGSGISITNDLLGDIKLENIKISQVDVSGFGDCGIMVDVNNSRGGFRNVLFENIETHDNAIAGLYIYGSFSRHSSKYAHENIMIKKVRAYKNSGKSGANLKHSGSGIVVSDTDGGVIEDSVAYENGWLCNSDKGGPVGVWAWDSNNIVIQRNESYSNKTGGKHDGGGFDLDGSMTNSVMQYNYSHDNDGAGYLVMQYTFGRPYRNNTVRYNISENDGRKNSYGGIHIWGDVRDSFIYNNTVISKKIPEAQARAIAIRQNDESLFFENKFATNLLIANNIFVTNGGVALVESAWDEKSVRFLHNDYFSTDSNNQFIWGDTVYGTPADWSAKTGEEISDGKQTALSFDPRFIDCKISAESVVFCLKADSPVNNNGLNLKNAFGIDPGERDFRGAKIPVGNYEIGAFETQE